MTDHGRALRERVVACRRELMEAALNAHAPRLPRELTYGLATIALAFERYE
jgi:hypothetical protein